MRAADSSPTEGEVMAGDDLAEILYQVGAYTPPWLAEASS
jgi:hypothetical protein